MSTKIKCGKCQRVIDAPAKAATLRRADRVRIMEAGAGSLEKGGEILELTGSKKEPPHHKRQSRCTVRAGVVTAVCRCGFTRKYDYEIFAQRWQDAMGRHEDMFLN